MASTQYLYVKDNPDPPIPSALDKHRLLPFTGYASSIKHPRVKEASLLNPGYSEIIMTTPRHFRLQCAHQPQHEHNRRAVAILAVSRC